MADETVAPAAPAPVATPAPAAPAAAEAAPAASPAAAAPAAVQAEAAPIATPAPAAAAPAVADAPTSILSEAKPASTEVAPPPVATPAPVEVAPVTPPPPPVYEAFKLPDGVTLDATKVSEFQTKLGQFEIASKADHAQMQAFGQEMVSLFVAEQQRSQQALVDSFNETRKEWRAAIKADPVYGGDNYTKSIQSAGSLIEQYGGTADQVKELRTLLYITGAGDHPALVRLFANAGKHLAQEGRPVPATVPKSPALVSKSARRYQNSQPNGSGS